MLEDMNDTMNDDTISAGAPGTGPGDRSGESGALPPPYGPTDTPPTEPRPPLRRSRDDRVIGGVAGGLARTFGVDPVVFRVVFVALTVIGGSGLVLYGLLWILVPEEASDGSSIADRWVRGRSWSTLTVVLLALAGAVAVSLFIGLDPGALVLLAVIAGIALFLTRREQRPPRPTQPVLYGPAGAPVSADPWAAAPPSGTPYPTQPYATQPYATQPYATQQYATQPYPPHAYSGQPYSGQPPYPPGPMVAPTPPRPPKPPRERSALGVLTLGLAALTAGILVAVRLADDTDTPSVTTILAATTLVLGLGLLVGTFVGRARWLVIPAVLLLLATSASGAVDRFDGPRGSRTLTPTTATEVQGTYQWGAGKLVLDLTQVEGDPDLTISVDLGAGSLRVVVPEGAVVTGTAHVGIGEITTSDGSLYDGFDNDAQLDDSPRPGDAPVSDQTITLDLEVGVGEVVVSRA